MTISGRRIKMEQDEKDKKIVYTVILSTILLLFGIILIAILILIGTSDTINLMQQNINNTNRLNEFYPLFSIQMKYYTQQKAQIYKVNNTLSPTTLEYCTNNTLVFTNPKCGFCIEMENVLDKLEIPYTKVCREGLWECKELDSGYIRNETEVNAINKDYELSATPSIVKNCTIVRSGTLALVDIFQGTDNEEKDLKEMYVK